MKFFEFIILLIACCVAYTNGKYTWGHNGKPLCVTDEDLIQPARNNFDPTKYWVCIGIGIPAMGMQCPSGTGFMDNGELFGCVDWAEWKWSAPEDPRNLAMD